MRYYITTVYSQTSRTRFVLTDFVLFSYNDLTDGYENVIFINAFLSLFKTRYNTRNQCLWRLEELYRIRYGINYLYCLWFCNEIVLQNIIITDIFGNMREFQFAGRRDYCWITMACMGVSVLSAYMIRSMASSTNIIAFQTHHDLSSMTRDCCNDRLYVVKDYVLCDYEDRLIFADVLK